MAKRRRERDAAASIFSLLVLATSSFFLLHRRELASSRHYTISYRTRSRIVTDDQKRLPPRALTVLHDTHDPAVHQPLYFFRSLYLYQ